jgi:lipoprotein signal peptidase
MLLIAMSFAAVDLAEKSVAQSTYHHARSLWFIVLTALLIIGLVTLVPRVPSQVALLGAAVAVGGALGNVISAAVWSQGVPDPLVIGSARGIAFNLADVFLFVGDAVMLSAIVTFACRHQTELRAPV